MESIRVFFFVAQVDKRPKVGGNSMVVSGSPKRWDR